MNFLVGLKLAVKVIKKNLDKSKMKLENIKIFEIEKKRKELNQRFKGFKGYVRLFLVKEDDTTIQRKVKKSYKI